MLRPEEAEKDPAAQFKHVTEPAEENVPAAHAVQLVEVAPAMLTVPARQIEHAVAPVVLEACPALQFTQPAWPAALWALPNSQDVQLAEPLFAA